MRILIVEDEPLTALLAEDALTEVGHCIVGTAASLRDAMAMIEHTIPDLVLSDIELEGEGDGVDLARVAGEQWNVPTLLASGSASIAADARLYAVGLLHKPYSADILQQAVLAARDILQGREPFVRPSSLALFREPRRREDWLQDDTPSSRGRDAPARGRPSPPSR